ncbi:dihydrofolate reductase family protein [Microbacterium koreense]|uniref:Dihydrofolate reductase family protein n=1 Tax=Microbacterium koreense TaxID=323761 RepID=A0ABW2ZSH7_9MICO
MPRLIYNTASTFNGFIADDDHSLEWLFAAPGGESGGEEFDRFLDGVGALVMGSSTYEWILAHENLLEHPEKWSAFYGARSAWVFTSRALPAVPGADIRFVSGEPATHWGDVASSAGAADVWIVGGGDLVGQFFDAGLLDEIRVSFAPAVLPSGKPLLPRRIGADVLELVDVRRNGAFAEVVYRVTRS